MQILKTIICTLLVAFSTYLLSAQGCSDAGFCTVGNFNESHSTLANAMIYKNEIDFSFTYATHLKNERFYQPQINYRIIKRSGTFFELRLPLGIARDKSSGISTTGIGDVVSTYNSNFAFSKKNNIDYSIGLRISFSRANKSDKGSMISYPMTLQNGLGTTDFIAVASYYFFKYLSIGTGVQLPVLQYNKNTAVIKVVNAFGSTTITGNEYRRKADALLKITGHYAEGKIRVSGGLLSIFHLADDYYNTSAGKFILTGSKGSTFNWNADIIYSVAKNWRIGLLVAEPFKTRKNIPDGLARSRIYNLKLTHAF